jgi:nucleoside-diphosphate-sugar epimerase
MRVLIIGGTGLISTEIVKILAARGDQITLFNRGIRAKEIPGVATVVGDRRDYPAFIETMKSIGPFDAVIEMICFDRSDADSLVEAFRGRCPRIVFCSTVDVYSRPATKHPYTEAEPYGPLSGYAKGKVECEEILLAAHARGDFETVILRPAHTYCDGGAVIHTLGWSATFLDRLQRGLPVVVHGDGQSLWSSCHAWDVAGAFAAALEAPVAGRSFHTAGFEWLTWNQYTRIAAASVGGPEPDIVHIPTDVLAAWQVENWGVVQANFQYTNIFDNSAAVSELGFAQTIKWGEGVRRIHDHYLERGGFPVSGPDSVDDQLIARWRKAVERGG